MKAIMYCALLFLCSCDNIDKRNREYFAGKDLWEKKCSLCHSFLTHEGLNQTSLSQMRQLNFETLYDKIKATRRDSNHTKTLLNLKAITEEDIRKITLYIIKTGEPRP